MCNEITEGDDKGDGRHNRQATVDEAHVDVGCHGVDIVGEHQNVDATSSKKR